MNTQLFIEKATKIHGDKYDYSKVEYINSKSKVNIICNEHGEFKQIHNDHLNGHGCKKCAINNTSNKNRGNKEEFIEKAIKIHGDKYDYSKVEYINALTKITIICKKHGEFLQKPSNHINAKQGCRICGNELNHKNQTCNTTEFIQKAIKIHGDKYDYSKVEYIKSNENVIIICKKHGEFLQKPNSHLSQEAGCLKCGKVYRYNTSEFIKIVIKIHGDKYDYSKVEYINSNTKITIICK